MSLPMYGANGLALTFEQRAKEDRDATLAAGHLCYIDVDFVNIYVPGGNDVRSREVTKDWLAKHLDYKKAYGAWKEGQEQPVNGIPLSTAPFLSAAQVRTLQASHVLTVEALADLPDNSIERMGMGASTMRNQAKAYLEAAEGTGKTANAIAARDTKISDLERANSDLKQQMGAMEGQIKALTAQMQGMVGVPQQAAPPPPVPRATPFMETADDEDSTPLRPLDDVDEAAALSIESAVAAAKNKPKRSK
jgi:hypothetical protein